MSKIIQLLRHAFYTFLVLRSNRQLWKSYTKGVKLKALSNEQKAEVQSYYMQTLGKKVDMRWHQLFYSLTGVFNVRNLPFEQYHEIVSELSPHTYKEIIDDKNFYRLQFAGFNIPVREVECANGVYYLPQLGGGEFSREDVIEYCKNLHNCIIKPSKDSCTGNGVKSFDSAAREFGIDGLLSQYKKNFVIERKIKNSKDLEALNPSSCNTFRVHTYRPVNASPKFLSSHIRIGRNGSLVDNLGKGGLAIGIDKLGNLNKYACTLVPYKKFERSDSGILFDGYRISLFPHVVECALKAHSRVPYFHIIGWDITIDDSNNIIIVEYNPDPDLRTEQLIYDNTSILGNMHDEILSRIRK